MRIRCGCSAISKTPTDKRAGEHKPKEEPDERPPPLETEPTPSLEGEETLGGEPDWRSRIKLPRGKSLRVHAAQGVVINSLFQIGLASIGLIQRLGIAAFLTQTEYGIWGLIVTTLVTLSWLKQVGVSDKYVQQDGVDQELAFQKAFTLELLYSAALYGLVLAALPVYAVLYGQGEIVVPGAVLGLVLVVSALQTPIWIAYRQMQFVRQRVLEAINPVVALIVTFALAAAGYGYWSLVIGGVAGAVVAAVAAVLTSPFKLALRYDRGTLGEYFSFSWPLLVSSAGSIVIVQGTVLVANFSVGLAGVGILGLATTVALFADRVDAVIRQTIYPAVCAVRDRRDVFFETFVKSNRIGVIFGLAFGLAFALFASDLVTFVLGDRWEDATGVLQAVGVIVGIRQIAFNWTVFIRADGDTRPLAVNTIVVMAAFILITAPLILTLGLTGWVIGFAASVVIDLIVRTYYLGKLFPGFRMAGYLLRSLLPSIPGPAAVLLIRTLETGPRSAGLAIAELAVYFVVTAAATFVFERALITEVTSYLRGRKQRLAPA